jgi:hypothetical protein
MGPDWLLLLMGCLPEVVIALHEKPDVSLALIETVTQTMISAWTVFVLFTAWIRTFHFHAKR